MLLLDIEDNEELMSHENANAQEVLSQGLRMTVQKWMPLLKLFRFFPWLAPTHPVNPALLNWNPQAAESHPPVVHNRLHMLQSD